MGASHLDTWKPLVEAMVDSQGAAPPLSLGALGLDDEGGETAGLGEILGQFSATMGPVLLGLQFGSAAGHLAQRALGQSTLPMPWPPSSELLVVPENIAVFAGDWSLAVDETQLWVCIPRAGRPRRADPAPRGRTGSASCWLPPPRSRPRPRPAWPSAWGAGSVTPRPSSTSWATPRPSWPTCSPRANAAPRPSSWR